MYSPQHKVLSLYFKNMVLSSFFKVYELLKEHVKNRKGTWTIFSLETLFETEIWCDFLQVKCEWGKNVCSQQTLRILQCEGT